VKGEGCGVRSDGGYRREIVFNPQSYRVSESGMALPAVRGRHAGCAACGRAVPGLLLALAVTAAAVAAGVTGCKIGPERSGGPAVQGVVTVLFGAGNQGVLSACGCAQDPGGGLSKRQTVVEDLSRKRPNVLVVDAGDMFPERPNPMKTRYVALALARARYDAIGLGDQEFALGAAQLQAMARDQKLPFICANVRDAEGRPVVPPHVIREIGGLRVGIFAVIADQAYGTPPHEWRKDLKIEPPVDAARREVRDLAGCDVVIALSHQPMAATRELAQSVPGLRLIVSGHDETVLRKPLKVGEAEIVGTGDIGRWLGAATFTRAAEGPPAMVAELVGLSPRVPDCKWVMDLYREYIEKSKDEPIPAWALTPVPPKYESADACGKCHAAEQTQWLTTQHAHAYGTIERVGRQNDPECILCHTMGYGRDGGFATIDKTPDLGRVTCQACHPFTADQCPKQAGKDPKFDPKVTLNSRLCQSCHGLVESPNFDYTVYKPKIMHKPVAAGKK
jgi:hypothetical protein